MKVFPAIDLYEGKVVRLFKGDYKQMTVYDENPLRVAMGFRECGAENLHVVDLEGARDGTTPNIDVIKRLASESGLFLEVGGGIRSPETISRYQQAGVGRTILGTAAVQNMAFTEQAVQKFGSLIAVGVDIRDGFVATHGWTEESGIKYLDFCKRLEQAGVGVIICTDISRDGALSGTNTELYRELKEKTKLKVIASGGVSSEEDITALCGMGLYGAILGKALYTGALDLRRALEIAGGDS